MTDTPSVAGMASPRSAGILQDYVVPRSCAPVQNVVHRRMFDQCSVLSSKPKCAESAEMGALNPDEDEDYSQFDRVQDWVACFGAFIIISSTLGLLQSYAVFAPAVQHVYQTGYAEASAIGCFSYSIFVLFLPIAALINRYLLKHRWTALFGMLLFFVGLLLDALTIGTATLYVSHLLLMAIGGSLAYAASMSICCDRFRKKLNWALAIVCCAGSFGTIGFYLLSTFILEYISYMWSKLCLAVIVLICMGACQTFPLRSQYVTCPRETNQNVVKECLKDYAKNKEAIRSSTSCDDDVPHKSILCVCICDISVFSDLSFMLWAVLNLIAISTIYIPYIGLVSAAYEIGEISASRLVAAFCIVSIVARFALISTEDHGFRKTRLLFVVGCVGNGVLYISLSYVETPGWLLIWGIVAGAMEGLLSVAVPRLTINTVPFKWLGIAWTVIVVFHGIAAPTGALMHVFFYHSILNGAPAWVSLGAAQFVAAILAFLLPNESGEVHEAESALPPPPPLPLAPRDLCSSLNYTSRVSTTPLPTFTSLNDLKGGMNDKSYTSNCPICSKIGCIPGCCPDCVPGGLTAAYSASSGFPGYSGSYFGSNNRSYLLSSSMAQSYSSYGHGRSYSSSFPGQGCKDFIDQMNAYLDTKKNCSPMADNPLDSNNSSRKNSKKSRPASKPTNKPIEGNSKKNSKQAPNHDKQSTDKPTNSKSKPKSKSPGNSKDKSKSPNKKDPKVPEDKKPKVPEDKKAEGNSPKNKTGTSKK